MSRNGPPAHAAHSVVAGWAVSIQAPPSRIKTTRNEFPTLGSRHDRPGGGRRALPHRRHRLRGAAARAGLYVVATPIGNLRDITLRALETLARRPRPLRGYPHLGKAPRPLRHPHAARAARAQRARAACPLLARLEGGARLALISDAGTPLLSDPGFPLVRAAQEAGLPVFAVPAPRPCSPRSRSPACRPMPSPSSASCRTRRRRALRR